MPKKLLAIVLICVFVIPSYCVGADKKENEKLDIGKIAKNLPFDLPQFNEVFNQAKKRKITEGWRKRISVEHIDFKSMTKPEKAFEAGIILADIAFLIMDQSDNVSTNLLEKAEQAILAIKPPDDIKDMLTDLRGAVATGSIDGKELQKELDEIIQKVFPAIRKNPDQQNTAMLASAAGFCRIMYLAASTVAGKPTPTDEQLKMFKYGGGIINHFIHFFTNEANIEFKKDSNVKDMLAALKMIEPIFNKKVTDLTKNKFSKDDISTIAKALEGQFN